MASRRDHTGDIKISMSKIRELEKRRVAGRRAVVKARLAQLKDQAKPSKATGSDETATEKPKSQFLRFMAASATCSLVDQLLAAFLFSVLKNAFTGADFLRILIANVLARCVSLSLNYLINHRLVFSLDVDDPEYQRSAKRESLPRFIALSAGVLTLSTLGVFAAHSLFDVPESLAKIVIDIALFFLNYNVQRKWVFRNEVTVPVRSKSRTK